MIMIKTITITSSPEQAESIASHILLLLIRSMGIMEISNVHVKLDGIEDVDDDKLDTIVESLSKFNADQLLGLCGISPDELMADYE